MKKLLLLALVFVSCTKEKQLKCYECELDQIRSITKIVCSEDGTVPTTWSDGIGQNAKVVNCK